MSRADQKTYLLPIVEELRKHWPQNRAINVVCHGHSVPAGYFATPMVDSLNAYPHLLHVGLKQRFPFAVVNVIVTAIGGETSESGARRFESQVLCHRPDVLCIDYSLNDRGALAAARTAWTTMAARALDHGARVLLLTPTPDRTQAPGGDGDDLRRHADQVRALADELGTGLVDSLDAFARTVAAGADLDDLLSWYNHPNRAGHELVARELLRFFPA